MIDRLQKLETALETLREWLRYDANCPCCDAYDQCLEGCTFATDCPPDAEHMEAARLVLRQTDV